ncbi:MAG: glycosyltransferase family 2 protein [bacterium]
MKTAIAFFVYRRPDYTRRVWEEICKAKPPVLLIVADGPRDEQDRVKCDATRAIVDLVDWPCDVRRNYSLVNMGCRDRMASGLDWVFEEVEEAIILEDDCLPDQSFFTFCDVMLDRYRLDTRVMHIGGNNVGDKKNLNSSGYYFSMLVDVWGWATWRRAWHYYDLKVSAWPQAREAGLLESVCGSRGERAFWGEAFDRQYRGASKTWDSSWVFTIWVQHGVAIVPGVNLVSNIGVGADSTHRQDDKWYMNMPTESLVRIEHLEIMMINTAADRWTYGQMYKPTLWTRIQETVLNPWAYGAFIRKMPVVGVWWARWRTWRKSAL